MKEENSRKNSNDRFWVCTRLRGPVTLCFQRGERDRREEWKSLWHDLEIEWEDYKPRAYNEIPWQSTREDGRSSESRTENPWRRERASEAVLPCLWWAVGTECWVELKAAGSKSGVLAVSSGSLMIAERVIQQNRKGSLDCRRWGPEWTMKKQRQRIIELNFAKI